MMENSTQHFPTSNKLHTDVLEERYGPIIANVLRHDDIKNIERGKERIREARLIDKENVLRTYALTFLTYDKNNKEISEIDQEIRS